MQNQLRQYGKKSAMLTSFKLTHPDASPTLRVSLRRDLRHARGEKEHGNDVDGYREIKSEAISGCSSNSGILH